MSNKAYLFVSNAECGADAYRETKHSASLECPYALPPLWTAMYEVTDIVFEDAVGLEEKLYRSSSLAANRQKCLTTLMTKKDFLISAFGPRMPKLFDQFYSYIDAAEGLYVYVNTDELWHIFDDDEGRWRDELVYSILRVSGQRPEAKLVEITRAPKNIIEKFFPKKPYVYTQGQSLGYFNMESVANMDDLHEYNFALAGGGFDGGVTWQ